MKRAFLLIGAIAAITALYGCSGDQGEPPPKGDPPKVEQATPDMKSPEQRGREAGGGGEGS